MSGGSSHSAHTSPGSHHQQQQPRTTNTAPSTTTQRTTSVSSGASPPHESPPAIKPPPIGQNAMSADVYSPTSSHLLNPVGSSFSYPFSVVGPTGPFDSVTPGVMRLSDSDRPSQALNGFAWVGNGGAILMRKLPRNTSREALRSMLLFAKDFVDADFVPTDAPEDHGFLSAIARFNTLAAAEEARALLDGKSNSMNDATMIVELYTGPLGASLNPRRNTIDHTATRGILGGGGSSGISSNGPLSRQSSRFNGTFQSLERLSAANAAMPANSDALSGPESTARLHSIFAPQSPIANGAVGDLPRVSGKSMIDQDPDEDTGELLKDPVGYAENGHAGSLNIARRSTNPQIPTSRFANLSLTTSMSPPLQNYPPSNSSARVGAPTQSATPYTPAMNGNNLNGAHGFPHFSGNPHASRHSLPAANPNDLNPPCNTLYVGNLPPDTSEEELKALFSKQRGYKRLCFRNKQNGPMCFVEFDEIAMASKALNELYGYKLSNSVKTGIRLSFSKNPLGVRSGQPGSMNSSNSLAAQGSMSGGSNLTGMSNMFSTVNGPPPGLVAPPGLAMPGMPIRNGAVHPPPGPPHAPIANNNNQASFNANSGLGIRTNGMSNMVMGSPPLAGSAAGTSAGANLGGFNGFYPDYMMGR